MASVWEITTSNAAFKHHISADDESIFSKNEDRSTRWVLWNNLAKAYVGNSHTKESLAAALEAAGIDPSRRAETLTIEEFARLSDAL